MNEKQLEYIFYLNFEEKLNSHFYKFDSIFKNKNITLVPLEFSQLTNFIKEKRSVFVIIDISTLRSKSYFETQAKKIIQYLLKNSNIHFIHLSSFAEENFSAILRNSTNYKFIRLPDEASYIGLEILKFYNDEKESRNVWAYGKSPRLNVG